LTAILESDEKLREVVSDELAEVGKRFGTPRRTVLLEGSSEAAAVAAVPLEVADDPCVVLMSATGLVARVAVGASDDLAERALVPPPADAARAAHDVIVAAVRATVRGTVGLVTSAGRLLKLNVLELPAMPPGAGAVSLAGGTPVTEFASFDRGETVVGLAAVDGPAGGSDGSAGSGGSGGGLAGGGLALGTAEGVVKRVLPDYPQNRDEFELITLKPGDRVVGAVQLSGESDELVFITSDAQLLRFTASSVRPQGRAAGGMAGVRLASGASVVWFGAADAGAASGTPSGPPGSYSPAVVVTVAGSAGALPGTGAASVKVTPLHEYPGKGRATGGVRCHRFLKGEDMLVMAWAGPAPAVAATDSGAPVQLPDPVGRRDGSGTPLGRQVAVLGGSARVV
jgi:DNA gyrase subunit A